MNVSSATYEVIDEVEGSTYSAVVHSALSTCSDAGFIIRTFHDQQATSALIEQLPVVARSARATKWPGTETFDGVGGNVITFPFTSGVAAVLIDSASGLFEWRAPALPEDLFFLTADGRVWLGTVSHERWAFSEMSDNEACEFVAATGVKLRRLPLADTPQ